MTNGSYKSTPLLLVIFGITGDLSSRKLLPALAKLSKNGYLPDQTKIIGISRQAVTPSQVLDHTRQFNPDVEALLPLLQTVQLDTKNQTDYKVLRQTLEDSSKQLGPKTTRLYYLSIPAGAFEDVILNLGETGHADKFDSETNQPRILVEKPFGYDSASASQIIALTNRFYDEAQIYRIDHYLAKETAQNLLAFRFQNPIFKRIWNAQHISKITIKACETIGIEGRSGFYEQTGALRDVIQSHLLQLLALITMEEPAELDSANIHRSKLRLLDSILPLDPIKYTDSILRSQYSAYTAEVDNPDSKVETYARLNFEIDNEQWRGTEIVVAAGKALPKQESSVLVQFRRHGKLDGENNLLFRIQPKEGVTLSLVAKKPGLDSDTESVEMEFDYQRSFNVKTSDAYERVIVDAIKADQSLFASAAEVMSAWRIVDPAIRHWSNPNSPLVIYEKGTSPEDL